MEFVGIMILGMVVFLAMSFAIFSFRQVKFNQKLLSLLKEIRDLNKK